MHTHVDTHVETGGQACGLPLGAEAEAGCSLGDFRDAEANRSGQASAAEPRGRVPSTQGGGLGPGPGASPAGAPSPGVPSLSLVCKEEQSSAGAAAPAAGQEAVQAPCREPPRKEKATHAGDVAAPLPLHTRDWTPRPSASLAGVLGSAWGLAFSPPAPVQLSCLESGEAGWDQQVQGHSPDQAQCRLHCECATSRGQGSCPEPRPGPSPHAGAWPECCAPRSSCVTGPSPASWSSALSRRPRGSGRVLALLSKLAPAGHMPGLAARACHAPALSPGSLRSRPPMSGSQQGSPFHPAGGVGVWRVAPVAAGHGVSPQSLV